MAQQADATHNLHSLYAFGQPLGVQCRACGRRGVAFDDAEKIASFRGNMRRLDTLRLKCRGCGSYDCSRWLLLSDEEARAWRERPLGGPAF